MPRAGHGVTNPFSKYQQSGLSRLEVGISVAVTISRLVRCFAVVVLAFGVCTSFPVGPAVTAASAQACPDVQVVFARGTGESPGVGPTGQAFVDTLRSRLGAKTLDVYAVDYPASNEWSTGRDGVRDVGAYVVAMANSCPQTKMVLGGYSQGAAVVGFITSAVVPDGVDPATVPKPLAPNVADHVSSVVLFGTPNERAMNFLGQPPVVIGPLYAGKTLEVCVPEDPVCSDGLNFSAHDSYADDPGTLDQGVDFATQKL